MVKSYSFDPIIDKSCKILILGTMPGIRSIEKQEYYAHERNSFWPIMMKIFNHSYTTEYQIRKKLLLENRIALWDTLMICMREGSLDSAIQEDMPNDIPDLVSRFSGIKYILFNGQYAEKFYKKNHKIIKGITYMTMPSTSPANARLSFEEKFDRWSALKDLL